MASEIASICRQHPPTLCRQVFEDLPSLGAHIMFTTRRDYNCCDRTMGDSFKNRMSEFSESVRLRVGRRHLQTRRRQPAPRAASGLPGPAGDSPGPPDRRTRTASDLFLVLDSSMTRTAARAEALTGTPAVRVTITATVTMPPGRDRDGRRPPLRRGGAGAGHDTTSSTRRNAPGRLPGAPAVGGPAGPPGSAMARV